MVLCTECRLSYVPGLAEDEELHMRYHDEYARGPIIEPLTALPSEPLSDPPGDYRVVWIDSAVARATRVAAARVAYVECRELGRPTAYDGSETAERPRLVVAMLGNRAVGMVVLADADVHWRLRWEGDRAIAVSRDRSEETEPRPGIGRVWIAGEFRGQQLGTQLVSYAAKRSGVRVCDMVWTIPLTAGGERLVRSLCPSEWLADGSWQDLFITLGEQDDD